MSEANRAEGGEERFIYRWCGHRFALNDIIDMPSAKGDR